MALQKKDGVLNTIDEMKIYLNEMSLSTMSLKLDEQIKDPNIGLKSADERIIDMVSAEYLARYSKKIKTELKKSNIKYPGADPSDLIVGPDREMDKLVFDKLITCGFIDEKKNLILTGPCGCGKTWIACAIGVKAATQLKTVRYFSTSKLVTTLRTKANMDDGSYARMLDSLAKLDLLILDDVGMMELDLRSCRVFFELLDSRDQNGSIIFISQYPVKKWYSLFESATYADASLSRATGGAYRLDIKGKDFRR